MLAWWTEQLAQIAANGSTNQATKHGTAILTAATSTSRMPSRKSRAKSNGGKSKYPMFRRTGDALVKIAWSKTAKSEYQHQTPKDVAVALLRKMQTLGRVEELLTMAAVLPLTAEDGEEIYRISGHADLVLSQSWSSYRAVTARAVSRTQGTDGRRPLF